MSVFCLVDDKHIPLYRILWVSELPHFCGTSDCQREGQYEIRLEQGESVWEPGADAVCRHRSGDAVLACHLYHNLAKVAVPAMSMFEDSRYRWRETYFVLFDAKKRPKLTSVTKTLSALNKRFELTNQGADDHGPASIR